jgi:hypothetical protein
MSPVNWVSLATAVSRRLRSSFQVSASTWNGEAALQILNPDFASLSRHAAHGLQSTAAQDKSAGYRGQEEQRAKEQVRVANGSEDFKVLIDLARKGQTKPAAVESDDVVKRTDSMAIDFDQTVALMDAGIVRPGDHEGGLARRRVERRSIELVDLDDIRACDTDAQLPELLGHAEG